MRAGRSLWAKAALALALLLAGCGPKPAPAPPPHAPVPRGVFDAASMDIERPCTIVTAQDASLIAHQPFYRTVAANVVQEGRVRCAQGVGDYGLHGMVEADMRTPQAGVSVAALFDTECKAPASPVDVVAIDPEAAAPEPPPAIQGRFCMLQNGAYALQLRDRVLLLRVRLSAGEIDPAASRRLASLVSGRLLRS